MANGAGSQNQGARLQGLLQDPATLLQFLQLAQSAQQGGQTSPDVGMTSPEAVLFGAPGTVAPVGARTLGGLPFTPNPGASLIRGIQTITNNARAAERNRRQQQQGQQQQQAIAQALLKLLGQGQGQGQGGGRLAPAGQGRTRTGRGFDLRATQRSDPTKRA